MVANWQKICHYSYLYTGKIPILIEIKLNIKTNFTIARLDEHNWDSNLVNYFRIFDTILRLRRRMISFLHNGEYTVIWYFNEYSVKLKQNFVLSGIGEIDANPNCVRRRNWKLKQQLRNLIF